MEIKAVVKLSQQFLINAGSVIYMIALRKERISVALTKDLITKLNMESMKARRSRSDFVQLILEEYFYGKERKEEKPTTEARMLPPAPSLRKSW